MNLDEWLQRLESLHPNEIEMGLGRVAQVSQRLPLAQIANRVVTVAGTNGKGSTIELMAALLVAAGLKVGCYTSPHIQRYNERVRVNGQMAGDQALCDAFARVEKARGDTPLTYFEFGTLAAFDLFARSELDVALLEVGLGGQLDATNIVDADVAVITSIALDHQEWLGNTREAIGYEKAGIMRAGAPVVCGDADPPLSVIHHAESLAAEFDCSGQQFGYEKVVNADGKETAWNWWGHLHNEPQRLENLPLPEIPMANAATAIQAVMRLGLPLDATQVCSAIEQTQLAGRYQRLARPVPMVLDVAHNPHAAQYLADRLQQENVRGKISALIGIMADKDYESVIQSMLPVVDYWSSCDLPLQRALRGRAVAEAINKQGAAADCYISVAEALDKLCEQLTEDDLLVVFGSFYTVSEALQYLEQRG